MKGANTERLPIHPVLPDVYKRQCGENDDRRQEIGQQDHDQAQAIESQVETHLG